MKPISTFGFRVMFFARFVSKIMGNLFPKMLAQTSVEISPPPKTKNPGYVPTRITKLFTDWSGNTYPVRNPSRRMCSLSVVTNLYASLDSCISPGWITEMLNAWCILLLRGDHSWQIWIGPVRVVLYIAIVTTRPFSPALNSCRTLAVASTRPEGYHYCW